MGSGEKSLPFKIRIFVYLSHTLSSWGDRMWSFGVGLFMVIISPESLRLTAIYGFASGGAILLLGALVGDWIDRTPRLKAARTTLVIQNTSVLVCAVCIFFIIQYQSEIEAYWPDQGLMTLCHAGVILIAVVSNLASAGTKIAVQKDWIIEICGRDKDALASMSATLRAIDLITLTVAPVLTGQIMTYASTEIGALFIGGWNLVSVFIEYYLLWKVYDIVPALRKQRFKRRIDKDPPRNDHEETPIKQTEVEAVQIELEVSGKEISETSIQNPADESAQRLTAAEPDTSSPIDKEIRRRSSVVDETEAGGCGHCLRKTFSSILTLIRGWKTYMKYDVAFAGLGLATLYMTVLGFDNITVGFAYSQGINESIMGILMAAGGLVGVLGAVLYPFVRRRVGLERTGLFGFFLEILFLSLCVASVWAPGSPFDLGYASKTGSSAPDLNDTSSLSTTPPLVVILNSSERTGRYDTSGYNFTAETVTSAVPDVASTTGMVSVPDSVISIWLLLAGIIGARCGLWMADLTITQLFLENVEESQRGIVNGVQTSLNQLMDVLKFVMVIVAPQPEVFGILIIISFAFILLGWVFYAKYSHQARGHLFHFDKIRKCECVDARNNNITSNAPDA